MLPSIANRPESSALLDTDLTPLGRAISPLVKAHPGTSGIFPLRDARDSFAARFLLTRAAERTLDLQYYIWRNDMSGTLLFKALLDIDIALGHCHGVPLHCFVNVRWATASPLAAALT